MTGLRFEDFAAGGEWETDARTVTGDDVDAFAALSGDRNPLHLDDGYARAAGFGGRIAHGVLGLAVATGLLNRLGLTRGTLVALLGVTWDFRRPVRPATCCARGCGWRGRGRRAAPTAASCGWRRRGSSTRRER